MASYGVEQRARVAAPAVDAAGVDDAQQVALGPAAMFHRFSADGLVRRIVAVVDHGDGLAVAGRSEEHTSELQSLMRISYAVFCLKKKNDNKQTGTTTLSNTIYI